MPGRSNALADGYDVTIVSGTVTYRNGLHTGALPGRLVRNPATRDEWSGRSHVLRAA